MASKLTLVSIGKMIDRITHRYLVQSTQSKAISWIIHRRDNEAYSTNRPLDSIIR